jgi:3-isopropylmalate/(R)-2-methylmalate dehydratase large subunit
MSIEAGARAGMIAADDTTFEYLAGRPYSPRGGAWDAAVARWRSLRSDPGAAFDREVRMAADEVAPMVTWGTSPEDALPITGRVPDPAAAADADRRAAMRRALVYMDRLPGTPLATIAIDRVFIGSCTNGRIDDLRAAAGVVAGRRVAPGVEAWVVPGSGLVKAQAEAEGLDRIFLAAGFQWRHAGCSMCLGVNGDLVAPGQRCALSRPDDIAAALRSAVAAAPCERLLMTGAARSHLLNTFGTTSATRRIRLAWCAHPRTDNRGIGSVHEHDLLEHRVA